jgi:signal transduction histidine kinase
MQLRQENGVSALEVTAWIVTFGVFILDERLPTGYAVGVLYVGVILTGLWIARRAFIVQYAAAASALMLLPTGRQGGHELLVDMFNRAAALGALWVTATGMTWFQRASASRDAALERVRAEAIMVQLGHMAGAVAHEVRNALAGVNASLQLLGDQALRRDPGVRDAFAERLDRLNEMVDDLLAFVDLREPVTVRSSLRRMLAEAEIAVRMRTAGADVPIRVDVPAMDVLVDRDQFRRAVYHVVLNGVQASPAHADVSITVRLRSASWQLEVTDHGLGLSPAARAHLFEPFFSTKTRGVGLGLAFVQRVMMLHGGAVDLRPLPDGGTAAVLEFPR